MKYLKYGFATLVLIIFALLHLFEGKFTMSKKASVKFAKDHQFKMTKIPYQSDSIFVIHSTIDSNKKNIVFIHGAPGSWDAFKDIMADSSWKKKYNLIAFDRPGYAQSKTKGVLPLMDEQAEAVTHIMNFLSLNKVTLITHSYGGPIGAYVAGKEKNQIERLILLAPVIDHAHEKMFWFSYIAIWPWTKWALPKSFQIAGEEKKNHALELKKSEPYFKAVECPVLFMHSKDDAIAPAKENDAYIQKIIAPKLLKRIMFENKGHTFLFKETKMVIEEIDLFMGETKIP